MEGTVMIGSNINSRLPNGVVADAGAASRTPVRPVADVQQGAAGTAEPAAAEPPVGGGASVTVRSGLTTYTDDDTGRVVVQVFDRETGHVIVQFPPETQLKLYPQVAQQAEPDVEISA